MSKIKISVHFDYDSDKNKISENCEPYLTVGETFDAVLTDVDIDRLLEGIYPILNILKNRIKELDEIKGG